MASDMGILIGDGGPADSYKAPEFLIPAPRGTQGRAVERALDQLRPQLRFTDADLRRLRQPRRKRVA